LLKPAGLNKNEVAVEWGRAVYIATTSVQNENNRVFNITTVNTMNLLRTLPKHSDN